MKRFDIDRGPAETGEDASADVPATLESLERGGRQSELGGIPSDAELVLAVPFAAERGDRRPAVVYLARLAPSGRRTMATALHTIADIISAGRLTALELPWHELRYEHTQAIRALLADRYAPATANRHLAALRGTLKAAWRLGLMSAEDHQRACDLEPVRGTTLPAGRALSPGEIAALFAACSGTRPADRRDAGILAVLYGCGLRRDEAVNLDVPHYRPADGQLIVAGKGSKERVAHLPPGGADALDAWLSVRLQASGPLFVPINKAGVLTARRLTGQAIRLILNRRARQAGVETLSPHDLRRTYITQLLDRGADLNVVRQLASHSSTATTARYDRRGERAQHQAAQLLHIPYQPEAPHGA